jgi:UDP-N-acetylglucosamine--N-acetylmuramyl-(pentapeptide) pyrophosphoryl-undecaprenol N-acetylglucosamine transferase
MPKSKTKQNTKNTKILISGGHLTPALAMIDFIQDKHPDVSLVFAGRKYSQPTLKQESQEKKSVTQRKVKFIEFNAPAIRTTLVSKLSFPFAFVESYFRALYLMIKQKPKLFLSFGGYLAIPLSLAAVTLNIPVLTHEQTRVAGQANKLIAKLSKKIAISYPESADHFPKNKTVLTGNPLRPELSKKIKTPKFAQDFDKKKPLLFITGGNQGSMIINTTIKQILPQLTTKWNVIHACGNPNRNINHKQELEKAKKQLKPSQQRSYEVREWVSTTEIAWIFQNAEGAITRAGANTLNELAYFKIPSIIIPLPFSKNNEQLINAKALTESGGATLLPQNKLNPQRLISDLDHLKKYRRSMSKKLNVDQTMTKAPQKLWEVISSLLS